MTAVRDTSENCKRIKINFNLTVKHGNKFEFIAKYFENSVIGYC